MKAIQIENDICPYCKNKLDKNIVHCPDNKTIPCLECHICKKYFYTSTNYNKLKHLARNSQRKLKQNVLKCKMIYNIGITAIILNDNRKCIHEQHQFKDVRAKLRIVIPSGEIIEYFIPAAYCTVCNQYFVLKTDFKVAQRQGAILCPVIDHTKEKYKTENNKYQVSSESRIHQLGYNVKKNNYCTTKQRQIILANIIENTNISKHEIQSNITRCIAQHEKQPNYGNTIACWKTDYIFVTQYKIGYMPQVVINKVVIGKRG